MSEYSKLAGFLHTLSCTKTHVEDVQALLRTRDPNCCYYYVEDSLSGSDQEPDHQTWEREAEKLCSELSTSPQEALRILSQLLDIRRRLDEVITRSPNAAGFAHLVLFDVRR